MTRSDSHLPPRLLTVPNLLCVVRFTGSFALIVLAWYGWRMGLLVGIVLLALTDWLDGKIAKWWHQQTLFGARLDSVTDATFYGAVLIALARVEWTVIQGEWLGISCALASYAVHVSAALVKFGTIPSYHTRLAKISWFLVGLAVISIFLTNWRWLVRLAMLSVVLTNVEAVAITLTLRRTQANVLSVVHAWRRARSG